MKEAVVIIPRETSQTSRWLSCGPDSYAWSLSN